MQRIDITQLKDGSFAFSQITIDGTTLQLSDLMCVEIMKAIKQTHAYQIVKKTADDYKVLTNAE